jgi:hypothetical protein
MEAGLAARQDELIIDPALDRKYEMALARLGVDPAMLSTEAGHALGRGSGPSFHHRHPGQGAQRR